MDADCVVHAGGIFEFSRYTIKDWLQLVAAVVGIIVAVLGAWKAWRFSKSQIVNRLFEYLNADEKHVIEGRRRVLEYLRNGKSTPLASGAELRPTSRKQFVWLRRSAMSRRKRH